LRRSTSEPGREAINPVAGKAEDWVVLGEGLAPGLLGGVGKLDLLAPVGEAADLGGARGEPVALGVLTGEPFGDAGAKAGGVGVLALSPPKKGKESHPAINRAIAPPTNIKGLRRIYQEPPHVNNQLQYYQLIKPA
jgi:hypothetical protein